MSLSLEILNPQQKQAVLYQDGPQLILAGAGSGKTRVITYKIANLVLSQFCKPYEILALTFTNKAASEMVERLSGLLRRPMDRMWVSTFHSFASRILRNEIDQLEYNSDFTIFDDSDKNSAIKTIFKKLDISSTDNSTIRTINNVISKAKTALVYPQDFVQQFPSLNADFYAEIYSEYEKLLKQNNSLDFDDLLIKLLELFRKFPETKKIYQQQFKYILVDEYQDTNHPQYLIVQELSREHRNICVVGDDDQAIYSWRGADIKNILDFQVDFPDAKVFKLEQNYRSTQNILNAASSVVNVNKERIRKKLWTSGNTGEPLTVFQASDEHEEAYYILEQIYKERSINHYNFSDIAIFYRTNAQSRILEEYCRKFFEPIPYNIVGGFKFYDRKEVKDLLSYLSLIHNPNDTISLLRVINEPKRGVGEQSLSKLIKLISPQYPSLFKVLDECEDLSFLQKKSRAALDNLVSIVKTLNKKKEDIAISQLLTDLDDAIGYSEMYQKEVTVENQSRLDNITELTNSIYEYEENTSGGNLADFLNSISLQAGADTFEKDAEKITMMTVHCAKGLEFPIVFICGLEDGLFPLSFNINDDKIEEERRLFYVAITRAKQKVYLTFPMHRRRRKNHFHNKPSRFLSELPEDVLEII